jgi:hypothetical protein
MSGFNNADYATPTTKDHNISSNRSSSSNRSNGSEAPDPTIGTSGTAGTAGTSLFKDVRELRLHFDAVVFRHFNDFGKLAAQFSIVGLARVDQDSVVEIAR